VQNHLANIYAKLGVASRTEAVTAALQRSLIRLNE
jgi:DNA-binding NarL/FixJ family response regulator